jgi:hypothetical protein
MESGSMSKNFSQIIGLLYLGFKRKIACLVPHGKLVRMRIQTIILYFFVRKVKKKRLKLRDFIVRFSAVNPCVAKNRYLLLQSALPISGLKQNKDRQATADSDKPNAHKCSDVLQQASTNRA